MKYKPKDKLSRRERLEQLADALWTERTSGFDEHWRELDEYLLPRRTRWYSGDKNRGDKRNQKIINSTGRFSARTLASGLHAGLTSPARPWMKLSTPDPELAKYGPVKAWLHEVTQRMLTVFSQTNLYNCFPVVYGDIGVFATGAMAMMPDSKDLFRCYNYAMGSWAIGLDARNQATTFVRKTQMTVRQVVEEYVVDDSMSNLSSTTKAAWDRGDYQNPVEVCMIVTPNEEAGKSPLAKHLPFASCHWETGSTEKIFLRESGYETFPYMVPRWDVTDGDSYGTDCPGMTVLGDVKQLHIMERRKGQAIAKMVDPSLTGPSSLRTQKVSLLPGHVTYNDEREGQKGLRSIHDVNLRVDHLSLDIEKVEYRVKRGFYEDLFLMMANGRPFGAPITAREVEERHEEKLIALGPVLERTNDELLDRVVDRAFGMMLAAGLIPEPPDQVKGTKLKVEYISILAQAQKLVGVVGQDRFLQSALALAEVFPSVVNKINSNRVIDSYADMLGIDPTLVRPDDEADAISAEQAQAAQAERDAAVAKDMANAVQAAGATPMDDDTALGRVVAGAAGAV